MGRGREGDERAREVLGLVLTALTRAFDDNDAVVVELGRRLRQHAGGKLLYSMTHGSLTLVPVDGRYMVDRQWLSQLDLDSLRRELDMGQLPENSLVKANVPIEVDVDVDVEPDDEPAVERDAYAASNSTLPPPPPLLPASNLPPPPLLSALPEESSSELPRQDTLRATNPLGGVRIPNLSISRLVKTPRTT
ncbi:MAG: hypothetical protein H0T76_09210 [Nannocystis sp.]|nr:hypothetical protein [Nannocystis sp.]